MNWMSPTHAEGVGLKSNPHLLAEFGCGAASSFPIEQPDEILRHQSEASARVAMR